MAKPKKCVSKLITIKNKRGTVVAKFQGHSGAACGPRKKPKTSHLKPFQAAMKSAAKDCKGEKGKHFRGCVANQLRANAHR